MGDFHVSIFLYLLQGSPVFDDDKELSRATHYQRKSVTRALRSQCLSVHFLLPPDLDVELSASSPAPCLPTQHHASHHEENWLNLYTVSQPQLNNFLYKSYCGQAVVAHVFNPSTHEAEAGGSP